MRKSLLYLSFYSLLSLFLFWGISGVTTNSPEHKQEHFIDFGQLESQMILHNSNNPNKVYAGTEFGNLEHDSHSQKTFVQMEDIDSYPDLLTRQVNFIKSTDYLFEEIPSTEETGFVNSWKNDMNAQFLELNEIEKATLFESDLEEVNFQNRSPTTLCNVAISASCGELISGNTADGDNNISQYGCIGLNITGPELVYSIELLDGGPLSVNLFNGSNPNLVVFLVDEDDCLIDMCYSWGRHSAFNDDLDPGTYYVVVDGFNGAEGTFELYINCEPWSSCTNPIVVECGETVTDSTLIKGVNNLQFYSCLPPGLFAPRPEMVYEFTLSETKLVTIDMEERSDPTVAMFLLSECDEDFCIEFGGFLDIVEVLQPGIYYISVDGGNVFPGDFTFSITCEDPPNICDVAIPASCGELISGNTADGENVITQYPCSGAEYTGRELVYSIELLDGGSLSANIFNRSSPDLRIFLVDENDCFIDVCYSWGPYSAFNVDLNSGTYYVIIDGFNGAEGTFELYINCETWSSCINPIVVECGETVTDSTLIKGVNNLQFYSCLPPGLFAPRPEMVYEFTLNETKLVTIDLEERSDNTQSLILLSECDEAFCINLSGFNIVEVLQPGTYYISVDGGNVFPGDFTFSITCEEPPNICDVAIPVSCGELIFGNTADGENVITQYPCSGTNFSGPELVYSIELLDGGSLSANLFNKSSPNLRIFLVDENDCLIDMCYSWGRHSAFNADLDPGTYYVVVDGFNGAEGTFELYINCEPWSSCSNPIVVECGETVTDSVLIKGVNNLQFYSCLPPGLFAPRPEMVYEFTLSETKLVTIDLEERSDNTMSISLLSECDEDFCIDIGGFLDIVEVLQPGTYYISVDGGNVFPGDFTFSITCEDPPIFTISCPDNFNGGNDPGFCDADVTLDEATTENGQGQITVVNDFNNGGADASDIFPVGNTVVTFTATDEVGDEVSCTTTVEVLDFEIPEALCWDLSWPLDENGQATGFAVEMNAGSSDNCAVDTLYASPDVFFCGDLGPNSVDLIVEDNNGNSSSCSAIITVFDVLLPNIICPADSTLYLPAGETEMFVVLDEAQAEDNCDINSLENSYNGNGANASDIFQLGSTLITFTATDISGNSASCTTHLTLMEDTTSQGPFLLEGNFASTFGISIVNVEGVLSGDQVDTIYSDSEGDYELIIESENTVEFTPGKDGNWLDGLTTLDLILIQFHILGLSDLGTPYQIIAADANADANLSTLDLILIQFLIIGLSEEIPGNTSWRFVPKDYIFSDPENPLAETWPESIEYNSVDEDLLGEDWVAMKTGDVTGDAGASGLRQILEELNFIANAKTDPSGHWKISFKPDQQLDLLGYQMELHYDPSQLRFANFDRSQSRLIGFNDYNLFVDEENGIIRTNWWNAHGMRLNDQDELFGILFYPLVENLDPATAIRIPERGTRWHSEAYTSNNQVRDLKVNWGEKVADKAFALHQNEPNPFSKETAIPFELPRAMKVNLEILDATGKLIQAYDVYGLEGMNHYQINLEGNPSGMIYYRLTAGEWSAVKKMILHE